MIVRMSADSPLIFISYATPDRARVTPYFEQLEARGLNVWMDHKRIKAGQAWDFEIKRNLDKASIIVVFVSSNSIDRRGYVQREIRIALDKLNEKLLSDIYIIPVLLDHGVDIPIDFARIHCVKTWETDAYTAINDAVDHQLKALGVEVRETQERSNIGWALPVYKESWDGLPGYEVEYILPTFSSTKYQNISNINDYLHGSVFELVMAQRKSKFEQNPDFYSFASQKYSRTNTLDVYFNDPIVLDNILSVQCNIHTYNAGAAHPNMSFRTYAFFLDPLIKIGNIISIFTDPVVAFGIIQNLTRVKLREEREGQEYADLDWVDRGTVEWAQFQNYIFEKEALRFLFAPYEVDCYAAGPQSVEIPYKEIAKLFRRELLEGLGLQYYIWNSPEK
jgi:hypothetical protein